MVVFLHDNAPANTAKPDRGMLETLSWKVLSLAAYSSGFAPSDYHLFASMGHALAEQRFSFYEHIKNGLVNSLLQMRRIFTGVVFINCPKDGEDV